MRRFGALQILLLMLTLQAHGLDSEQPVVVKLTLHDTIQPITAGYLERGLRAAAKMRAAAVLVSLGTPVVGCWRRRGRW